MTGRTTQQGKITMTERTQRAKRLMSITITVLISIAVVALGALAVVMHT
jgi:hypothetical protein